MTFKKIFEKLLLEDSIAGDGGVFGDLQANPDGQFSSDFYAPGDARNLWGVSPTKKRKKGKKQSKIKKPQIMPVQRRAFNISESLKPAMSPFIIKIKRGYDWSPIKKVRAYSANQAIGFFRNKFKQYDIYEAIAEPDHDKITKAAEDDLRNRTKMRRNKDD